MTRCRFVALPVLLALTGAIQSQAPIVTGVLREWQKVELTFSAPFVAAENGAPNPFLDHRLNVRFTRPDGSQLVVPGFFAADGKAANTSADSGDKWRAILLPDQHGTWSWEASFRSAPGIGVELDFDSFGAPVPGSFDATSGTLAIDPVDPFAPEHRAKGRLERRGTHYLRFAENHEPFLKGGANSPENLLGYYEFDNTFDLGGASPATADGLHHFNAHLASFSSSDPLDTADQWMIDKGRRLLGAINYLASQGINAMFFLTYSIDGGDSRDTWPWRDPQGTGHKLVYDVSKLAQWDKAFAHMQVRGVAMHVVLQEIENDQRMGGLGTERMLYYRELVARFAHHQALVWNIGEENSSPAAEQIAFADYLRAQDPYDHPITVHNQVGLVYPTYAPLYGTSFDATSIQGSPPFFHTLATDLRQLSSAAGGPFAIFADEAFSPSIAANMSNLAEMRSQALWGNLMGGGAGIEWYFSFADATLEDFRPAAPLWDDTQHALEFFRRFVYVDALAPDDGATLETDDHVLAEGGETYVIYRPAGGGGATLLVPDMEPYRVQWFDPRNGGALQDNATPLVVPDGSALLSTGAPPSNAAEDWVILVRKSANRTPVVTEFTVAPAPVSIAGPIVIRIHARDPDGPDDIREVGMAYISPGGHLGSALTLSRGGDQFTLSRNTAATLELGTWSCAAGASDLQGALGILPGAFTIVP